MHGQVHGQQVCQSLHRHRDPSFARRTPTQPVTTSPSILTDRVLPSRWSLIARIVRLRRDRPHARSGLDPLPGAALAASQRADDASLSLLLPVTQMASRSHASRRRVQSRSGEARGAGCGQAARSWLCNALPEVRPAPA